MGREVRRVPADWEHPKRDNGHYRPMFDKSYRVASEEWIAGMMKWEAGDKPDSAGEIGCRYYWEWYGAPPDADEGTYREREWTPEEATHYQLYETTSEGTPISPIFDNLDDLCMWAAENATTFASWKATKNEWRAMLDKNFVHHQEGNMLFM